MFNTTSGKALAVYIGESDHVNGKPVHTAIVEAAREAGLVGATVTRAIMGYGAHNRIHTTNIVALSEDLPVIVNLVDTPENIDGFLPTVEALVIEGTIVVWDVEFQVRSGQR